MKSFYETLTFEALLVRVASPIFWASAYWNVICCFANGTSAAWIWVTGVYTVVFNAGLIIWTLIIVLSLSSFNFKKQSISNAARFFVIITRNKTLLTRSAASESISSKARGTATVCLVIFIITLSIWAARIWWGTWIDTVTKITSFIPWAFLIWLATNRLRNPYWKIEKDMNGPFFSNLRFF